MNPQSPPITELSPAEKDLIARGGYLSSIDPKLDLLVALTEDQNPGIAAAARSTLSRISNEECSRFFSDTDLPESVSRYYLHPANARQSLMSILLGNPATPEDAVTELAATGSPELVESLLDCLDLLKTPALEALKRNPSSPGALEKPSVEVPSLPEEKIAMALEYRSLPFTRRLPILVEFAHDSATEVVETAESILRGMSTEECLDLMIPTSLPEIVARYFLNQDMVRPALLPLLLAHPSTPLDAVNTLASTADGKALLVLLDHLDLLKTQSLRALKENTAYLNWQTAPPPEGYVIEVDLLDMLIREVEMDSPFALADSESAEDVSKESLLKKLAKMSVAKRVILALRGNREERAILIRDGSKVVSRAVLGSPKLSDSEVEMFAGLKNVSQEVLRLISMNRKFVKNYVIIRALVSNPRTPIDVGLTFLNRLFPQDLRSLSSNRDISDTLRKMATRMMKTKEQR